MLGQKQLEGHLGVTHLIGSKTFNIIVMLHKKQFFVGFLVSVKCKSYKKIIKNLIMHI